MEKPECIDHILVTNGTCCATCVHGRHNLPQAGECMSCGWKTMRDSPYIGLIPVWKEDHMPTDEEREQTSLYIKKLLEKYGNDRSSDYPDGIFRKE